MGARLAWRDAAGIEGSLDLGFTEVFIGRAVECAVRTDDPMTSRRHARVYFQDGRHVIEDLGSANGIYVGDARTQVHALSNGDQVRCGNLIVRYVNDVYAAPPSPYGAAPPAYGGPPPPAAPSYGGPPPPAAFGGPPPPVGGPPPPYGGPPPPVGGPPPPYGGPPPPVGGPPPAAPSFGGGPPPPVGAGPKLRPSGQQSIAPSPFGPPPAVGGGPPPAFGPPPAAGGAAPRPQSIAGAPAADGGASPEEVKRLQRRVEQLQAEVRILRGGGDKAVRMEDLEAKVATLEKEKIALEAQVKSTEGKMAAEAGDLKVQRAGAVLRQADEVVNGLNDVLSELRINVMAAEGEVEQWSSTLPKASFELVRESLRSCRAQMETAKELMRQLRDAGQ